MKKLILKNTLVFAFIFICGFAYSQEIVLKYELKKGKTFTQSIQLTQNGVQSMQGQEMKSVMDINASAEMFVEDISADGNITVIELVKNVSIHSKMMGRDTTMNFPDINEKSRVVYSSDGKQLSKMILDSGSVASISDVTKEGTKFFYLPGKKVKTGEKWVNNSTDTTKVSQSNPLETIIAAETEYTYDGKELKDGKQYDKISIVNALSIEGKGSQMGMEMLLDGTGKSQGFAYFDSEIAFVSYSEILTEMDMSIAIVGMENMTIPMSQSIKIITITEEKK